MSELPQRIGPFRILEVLGEGGMGRVYLAEQDEPARRVALKVLRTAALGGEALARFKRESELLAELEHSNIARLYASGTAETSTGAVPWLALELVKGQDLVRHADAQGLDLKARLAMLAVVCRAVHHAHTRGVIHRDLKPANVLVDEYGVPKILDFGVARVVDAEGSRMTQAGEVLGTIPYMSPEQLEGSAHRVDPRGDVYSLGVIGYQLLSGQLPFPGLDTDTIITALAKLRSGDAVALGKVAPLARGDAETIIMKALATDPARRYQSAVEFAADLERFVDDQPIEARPPTVRYVLSVFVRRHRGLATGAGLSLLAILLSAGFAVNSAISEARARQEAETRSAELAAVNDFMVTMLTSADPDRTLGQKLTVLQVLDAARVNLESDGTLAVPVATSLREALASSYAGIAAYEQALALAERAHTDASALYGANDARSLSLLLDRIKVMNNLGRYEETAPLVAELEAAVAADASLDPTLAIELGQERFESLLEQGKQQEAEPALRATLALAEQKLGHEHKLTQSVSHSLALLLQATGKFEEAYAMTEANAKLAEATFGPDHPETLMRLNFLGPLNNIKGDPVTGEKILRGVLEGRTRIYGAQHPATLSTQNNLTMSLVGQKRFAEAEPMAVSVVAGLDAVFGAEHNRTLTAQGILATIYMEREDYTSAERMHREILAVQERTGRSMAELLPTRNNLASTLMRAGRLAEAEREFAIVVREAEQKLGKQHPYSLIFAGNYGDCLRRGGKLKEARAVLERALAAITTAMGASHPRTAGVRKRLRETYEVMGLKAEAAALVDPPAPTP
jgi:tetratricopeptide (TPR) repeat protein